MTRRGWRAGAGTDRGQSSVELALALPLVAMLLLLVVQVALLGRDQILVTHAAREAARAAAVVPSGDTAASAQAAAGSGPLDPSRLSTVVDERGGALPVVEVHVRYRAPTDLPLIGALMPDVTVEATATMRRE